MFGGERRVNRRAAYPLLAIDRVDGDMADREKLERRVRRVARFESERVRSRGMIWTSLIAQTKRQLWMSLFVATLLALVYLHFSRFYQGSGYGCPAEDLGVPVQAATGRGDAALQAMAQFLARGDELPVVVAEGLLRRFAEPAAALP